MSTDINNMVAVQAVISSTMADMKDILKMSFAHNLEVLNSAKEEDRKEIILAIVASVAADTAATERMLGRFLDSVDTAIPAVAAAVAASEDRREARRAAERKAQSEREALAALKGKATNRWSD